MDDAKRGRAPFYFVTMLTVIALISQTYTFFFAANTDAAYTMPGPGPIEAGAWIFIPLLLVYCFWNSILTKGWALTIGAGIVTLFICWLAEGLGVHYGYVFGHYHYTHLLGFQIWAVPILVCFAWEPILYSAYYLTDFLLPMGLKESHSLVHKVLLYLIAATIGGIVTTAWDLMIDPFMVKRGCWVWEEAGPYMQGIVANGVPLSNYFGWWKVAFVCHIIFRLTMDFGKTAPRRSPYLTVYGPMMLYFNLFIGQFTSVLIYLKRPDVAMIGLFSMGAFLFMGLAKIYLLKTGTEHSHAEKFLIPAAPLP